MDGLGPWQPARSNLAEAKPSEYDPSYEWPGLYEETHTPESEVFPDADDSNPGTTSTSFLRLVALNSAVLPSKHRIAVLTGYPEAQIGRDKPMSDAVTPRIRLKEMEVSKIHATVYWNGATGEWALVDMGSMHGTFWRSDPETNGSGPSTSSGANSQLRLSPSRVASLPRPLRHLDLVTIGSTIFEVHIHKDDLACSECALAGNEISMFYRTPAAAPKRMPSHLVEHAGLTKTDPKKSLALLKQSLLHQHAPSARPKSSDKYTDRADRRRRMYGSLPLSNDRPRSQPLDIPPPPPPPIPRPPVISDPPQRLTSNNVGHNLLTKMGWEPGTTLGLASLGGGTNHLLEPIQPKHTTNRAGLGVGRNGSDRQA